MANETAKTITTNIVPVQGTFEPLPPFACIDLIGPGGTPFFAPINPVLDGVSITNSTINSSTVGLTTPAAAQFTTASQQNQPIGNNDLTTKLYVDSLALGIAWKQPVNAATTANITLSGVQTIDTVSVVAGDRVLVKDQTAQAENGIYVAAAGAWSRSPDADTYDEMISALVFVESGGQAGAAFYCPIQPGGTLGTTAITWNNFSVGGVYFAGTGLNLSGGDTFNITNTAVAAGAYGSAAAVPSFTVNAQGQLTAAADVNIAIAATQITSGTIDSARLSGTYSGITGLGTLTDLTVSNVITGSVSGSAASATTATNLAGGAAGSIPVQSGAGATSFLAVGTNGQVLTVAGGIPSYATPAAGTVTSVSGTGTVSGISLSGTVTSTGDLTLGGTLDLSSPPVIGNTAPNTATFTTVNATTFDTNVAAAGVTLTGVTLSADGTDANINVLIDPKGNGGVGIGGLPTGTVGGQTITSKFCVKDEATGVLTALVHVNNTVAASPSILFACRSRGTLATQTIVQNNDSLTSFISAGFDGTDLAIAARIDVEVDGTPGNNDMPGRMVFKTTPDGSQTPTEAMRISSNQTVTIGTAAITNATVSTDLNLTGTLSVNGDSGIAGYVLTSNGALDPTWQPSAGGLTIVDDTTTNSSFYLTFTSASTGNITTANVSSTKLQFNPSTGALSSTLVGIDSDGTASAPSIFRTSDTNTGIFFPAADQVGIATNGVERVEFGNSETVFNDGGVDVDFRVEGDTDADLLFVDASTDRVGIGTNTPTQTLSVDGYLSVNSNNISADNSLGFRNRIINGGFGIAQRGTSFVSGANNDDTYNLDRWYVLSDDNDVVDITQTTTVPTGANFSIGLDVETTNKKFGIAQIIENSNCFDAIGQTVTLSFDAKVSSTTKLDNVKCAIVAWSGTADTVTSDIISAWGAEGTNPTLIANATYENTPENLNVTTSFARYTVSAAVDTASTKNIIVFIWSDVTDTTAGDFLNITNVQLEVGAVATPFERRPFGTEFSLCQRYFEVFGGTQLSLYVESNSTAAPFAVVGNWTFGTQKRAAPTMSTSGSFTTLNTTGSMVLTPTTNNFSAYFLSAGAGRILWFSDAGGKIIASIEL